MAAYVFVKRNVRCHFAYNRLFRLLFCFRFGFLAYRNAAGVRSAREWHEYRVSKNSIRVAVSQWQKKILCVWPFCGLPLVSWLRI